MHAHHFWAMDDEFAFSALTREEEKEFLSDLYLFTLHKVMLLMECVLCVCVCVSVCVCYTIFLVLLNS